MLNATLLSRISLTDDLLILHLLPDSGVGDFQPGQYVALALPGSAPRAEGALPEKEVAPPDKLIKRAYSIGSSPCCRDYLEFYIAVVPDGTLTPRLAALREGDRLFVAPKITGTFTLAHLAPSQNLVFVSTGTGIAPFMSMIRTPSTWTEGRRITMIHGVRYVRDLAYREELQMMAAENPRLSYFATVSREEGGEGVSRGYVQSFFSEGRIPVDASQDQLFVCGNPAMIDDLEKLVAARGFTPHSKKTPGNLHYEKYW